MRTLRAWLYGGLAGLLAACGTQQGNVPDQPPGDSQVIVIGGPAKQPVQVAEPEPEPTLVQLPRAVDTDPDADLAEVIVDSRQTTWSPRAIPFLVTEIQGLESLFAATSPNASDRPRIIKRLAERYYELVSAARRDKRNAATLSAQGDGRAAREVERLEKMINAARKKMADYYELLAVNHPTFCESPNAVDPTKSQGCTDDALYFLGLEYQRMGSGEKARKAYLRLIQSFPYSPWIPSAYLAFGEFFFAEGQSDPAKLDYAKQAYEKVVQFPPPRNEVFGFAHYRLAQIHKVKQDYPSALNHLMKASEFVVSNGLLRGSPVLGQTVRRSVVPIYAITGTPSKAEPFFKRFLTDPSSPSTNRQLIEMIDALVRTYQRDFKRAEAKDVCYGFSGGVATIPACSSVNSVAGQQTP